jgi:hypothetical protein
MPRQTVWFIRASLLYLLAGFTIGALILAQKGRPYDAGVWLLLPVHIEFLLAGWLLQLVLGMAFWIFPRFGVGAARGRESWIWVSFALLNLGILLVVLQLWLPLALLLGRLAEAAGILVYIGASWARVKPLAVGG